MGSSNAQKYFNIYKDSLFRIDNDLRFWKEFLKSNISALAHMEDKSIQTAIFCAYDHDYDKISGTLKCNEKIYQTNISELEKRRADFFNWIMNLSILKAYNALEILILQAIQAVYFPQMDDPIKGKKRADKINSMIKEYLQSNKINPNTKNNEHLIEFLTMNSVKLKSFLNLEMNNDLNTRWQEFFYMISILRNVVAHCGMIVQLDIQNEIKSKAKDIFERHFEIILDDNRLPILSPRENIFGDFINYINSLSISIYKFVFDQDDLNFIGLK